MSKQKVSLVLALAFMLSVLPTPTKNVDMNRENYSTHLYLEQKKFIDLIPKVKTEPQKEAPKEVELPKHDIKKPKQEKVKTPEYEEINIIATGYTSSDADCGKNDGITASGYKANSKTIAVPKDIKFGTIIEIEGVGRKVALDNGGAIQRINSNTIKIDIWFPSEKLAKQFGVKKLKGKIVYKPTNSLPYNYKHTYY